MSGNEPDDKEAPPSQLLVGEAPHDKLIADILSQKIEGFSMGCQIEKTVCTVCTVCGSVEDPCDHAKAVKYDPTWSGVRFISFGLVEGPKHCDQPMKFTGPGTFWTCVECGEQVNPGFGGILTKETP